ncbi:hypothetical protein MTO96_007270 [Rhipicephalus appendiculatus]
MATITRLHAAAPTGGTEWKRVAALGGSVLRDSLGSPNHNGRPRQLPVHEPYKEPPCVRRGMQVLSSRQYDLHIHSARGQSLTTETFISLFVAAS